MKWHVIEKKTDELMQDLKKNRLDVGIMATPLEDINLFEQPVYYEEMMMYLDHESSEMMPLEIDKVLDSNQIWLLSEGHCFRSQVLALCEKKYHNNTALQFEAGSIETLMKMVDKGGGCTIIPEMCFIAMDAEQQKKVKKIAAEPQREISIVSHRGYEKELITNILKVEIESNVELARFNPERRKRKNLVPKLKK
ncbi:MAG: LysR substrate-binding domain-containing protein [Cytophagales bacterium]